MIIQNKTEGLIIQGLQKGMIGELRIPRDSKKGNERNSLQTMGEKKRNLFKGIIGIPREFHRNP